MYRSQKKNKQDVDEFAYTSAGDANYDKRKCGLSSIPADVLCGSSGRCSENKSDYSNHEVSVPVQGKSIEPLDADWKKTKWASQDWLSLSLQSGNSTFPSVEKEHMFDKVVTPSDVGKLNRLVIPTHHAEKYFPLDSSSNEKGLLLNFEDRNGKAWRFRYSYWNSSQSYVMTKGWSRFVKENKLNAGDIVSFQRGIGKKAKHCLYIDWRRRPNVPYPTSFAHLKYSSASHSTEENASKALNVSTLNMGMCDPSYCCSGQDVNIRVPCSAFEPWLEIKEPQHGSRMMSPRTQPEIELFSEINAGNYGFSTPGQNCTKRESAIDDFFSWRLFCRHVGEVIDSSTIQPLAKKVVEMCCHYSHAIILMASALKGVSDVCIWKKAVETLRKQSALDHEEKLENLMFNVLSFSYENLQDDITRKCLKSCALLSGNQGIAIEPLIQSWIKDCLIDGYDKGSTILETLISANLLECLEGDQFVKLQETVQRILVDQIILPKECQSFLMCGSMKLTEPPAVEEWERSEVINLMDNELSFLPKDLRCTILQALLLQRNCKLRVIPSSFFNYMPALQLLNLSRTRIKSLPESLFKLINLKRLFLNHCDLLMTLPPRIGELKHLEVLDLDGTRIMSLPQEVGLLASLMCLEVSFLKPMNDTSELPNYVIPCGVISTLLQLEELNLDVSPEDQWWNACAEAVISEFCGLTTLKTLKFYFPRVELLSHLKWNSIQMVSPSLSYFSFTVGHHVNRIVSRLPLDVEFELQQYDRCLKYVSGKGIPEDIQKVLRHATAFSLDRHKTVKKLSDFGFQNMMQLKCCVVGECNELQAIMDGHQALNEPYGDNIAYIPVIEYLYIHYMKNLRCIWEGPLHNSGLFFLKSLTLRACPELTTVFTPGLLASLTNLKELTVDDCPRVISLISSNNSEQVTDYFLPNLRRISLHYLPDLASISNGFSISPILEWMSIYYCPNLKSLPISKAVHGYLRKIKGEVSWWRTLKWEGSQQHSWDDVFVEIELCD